MIVDRLPPQNLEAEITTLGACLEDESVIDDVFTACRPEDFYRDDHVILAETLRDMRGQGRTVDAITVSDELEARGTLARVGGVDWLSEVLSRSLGSVHARDHAAIVAQKAHKRRIIEAGRKLVDAGYCDDLSAREAQSFAERAVMGAESGTMDLGLKTMADAMDGVLTRIERQKAGEVEGIATGLIELDRMIGGFQPTQLIIVAARPGRGKSTLALNLAEQCALDSGIGCLFVSQEMSDAELAGRSLASRSGVDHSRIRTGKITFDDAKRMGDTYEKVRNAGNFWIDDIPGRTPSQVASAARRLMARHGLGMVVVDYLQLLESDGNGRESRQEQVASISRGLKRMAMDLRVPVVALSQLNRNSDTQERRPRLADLRESGAIENDANVVILLHPMDGRPGVVECIVEKQRNGPTGIIPITYLPHLMRFENFADEPSFGPPPCDQPGDYY